MFIILGLGFYLEWDDKATRERWASRADMSFEEMMKDINDDS